MFGSNKPMASWLAVFTAVVALAHAGPLLAQAASVRPAAADETAGTQWPVKGVEAPRTELVLEAYVKIAPAVQVGKSDAGTRRFIPITRGRFVGDGIKGEVMAGGAVVISMASTRLSRCGSSGRIGARWPKTRIEGYGQLPSSIVPARRVTSALLTVGTGRR